MSWRYLPASVVSNMDSREQQNDMESSSGQLVMSSGTTTASKSSKPGSGTASSTTRRSGATSKPSMGHPGVESWISSLADSPARIFPLLAGALALRAKEAASGAKCFVSFAKYDRGSCSWKTSQRSVLEGLDEFSETWPRAGISVNGTVYLLPPSAPLTEGIESLPWPTPTASSSREQLLKQTPEEWAAQMKLKLGLGIRKELSLAVAVKLWPTPRAADRGGSQWKDQEAARRSLYSPMLSSAVCLNENQITGKLNPKWVDWLMGFPIGWSDCTPLVMPLSLKSPSVSATVLSDGCFNIDRKFWSPSVTSQYLICPVPFHLDTYKGCMHNCCYCFGRDITNFHRRHTGLSFEHLVANDPDRLKEYLGKILTRPKDFEQPETVFLHNRVPLKIGAISDPCPPVELRAGITRDVLRILAEHDYPIEIQTKNPGVLYRVLSEIPERLNLTIAISLITLSDEWAAKIEPGAPRPSQRIRDIERITGDLGYPVMIKVQPAIYPRILEDLPDLVAEIKRAGAWAFNTEGLKVRITMPAEEQEIFAALGKAVREDYRGKFGKREASDYVLREEFKVEYIDSAEELAHRHGLKYFSADNEPLGRGCGPECCGTEVLRDYQLFHYNLRSRAFGSFAKTELGECRINFTRAMKYRGKTLNQAVDDWLEGHESQQELF